VGRIKLKLLLAIVIIATLAVAVPAWAQTFTIDCDEQSGDCRESPFNDLIIGTRSADDILADFPGVNNDRDRVEAAQGNDEIHVRDGDARDTVDCGKGRDEVWANRHDDIANNCERVRYN
jgi:hypothetical protein